LLEARLHCVGFATNIERVCLTTRSKEGSLVTRSFARDTLSYKAMINTPFEVQIRLQIGNQPKGVKDDRLAIMEFLKR
jgi:hypothetical protein